MRGELEEEKLRVERLKVGGKWGSLPSLGQEVGEGVPVRVGSQDHRTLCLIIGEQLGPLVPALGVAALLCL